MRNVRLLGPALLIGLAANGCSDRSIMEPGFAPGEASFNHTSSGTVVVWPGWMDGWTTTQSGTASTTFVNGPGSPPLGTGSVQLSVGPDGNSAAQLRSTAYAGVKLADLTALSYSTFVQQDGSGGQTPYLILNIDLDGNGSTDDLLFFEPVYQTGTYAGALVPDQCGGHPNCILLNTWRSCNALVGGWWSLNAFTFGPPLTTLQAYAAANPNARIAAPASGGVRIVTGFGSGAWDHFVGNADAFGIGVSGNTTTYDFELLAPNPSNKDQCKNGGWQMYGFRNQGQCVRFVEAGKDTR